MMNPNFIDAFRNQDVILAFIAKIQNLAQQLPPPLRPLNIMEVCGGHTHTLMRYGLGTLLEPALNFVHGPGCPVCVMPKLRIDQAIALACMPNSIVVTLADLIRVPGSQASLQQVRAQGKDVRFVYSPLQVLQIAQDNPSKKVVFIAIGFETTTPMSASLIQQAQRCKYNNLFFHLNHVLVPPSVRAILNSKHQIHALIAPSHVSVISGAKIYAPFVQEHQLPVVVAGFEPVDMLEGIYMLLKQVLEGRTQLEIQYSRVVSMQGNLRAQNLVGEVMQPRAFAWRGLGEIPFSGMGLRPRYANLDAEIVFKEHLPQTARLDHKLCLCGDILKGVLKPLDCSLFGTACTPTHPIGACMVSSEGACAAYYRYSKPMP
ncbi:Hydrogenase expression/formation protein HypD [Helicobacter bizzozeronii]|uniref:hydrogenase formation protein HypD n=1 Tax=Helicobacter bizzozeronii TaxID=56877 RepID=UPI00244D92BF|nr:hydrogenase formation protein HypD [Helicobacter bizzozeronii]GMB92864.1 Hydrogenase expression/formation protein HypD [Helicobacter bizzozeronii]